jgi:hypothetical protein
MGRQLRQLRSDLVECETDSLRKNDESDPSQDSSGIASLTTPSPLGGDQSTFLVKAKRGGCDPAATRHFTDQEQVVHAQNLSGSGLDFKFT